MLDLVKLCSPGTEKNPFTKRCNKKCKKGKERIRLDQTNTYRCYKTCEKPRTRNTRSNRCSGKRIPSSKKQSHTNSRKSANFFNRSALWGD